jgi:hypothetical protein
LLLLPGSQDREAVSQLLTIAADAARAFPDVFDDHLVLRADAAASRPALPGVPAWLDVDGRLNHKLDANDRTLILVRPDGYIGYRCQPADGGALMTYMGRYLVSKR